MNSPLDNRMIRNDAEAKTFREYFRMLLLAVWIEKEGFSGKRPFGNSGWEYELFESMAKNRMIEATFDDEGELLEFDREAGSKLVTRMISQL